MARMLPIGSKAPDFKLRLDTGENFRLRDVLGKQNIIITFFPDDFPRNEARDTYPFLQNLQQAQTLGAAVVAVSPSNLAALRKLLTQFGFSISIAADPTLEVCRNYRATWLRGLGLRQLTYVIDRNGIIQGRISHQLLGDKPWEQILRLLRELGPASPRRENIASRL